MNDLAAQVRLVANSCGEILRKLIDLTARVVRLEQAKWASGTGSGGGGSSSGAYYCVAPSSGSWPASWSGGAPVTPGSFTATVYWVSGTTVNNLGTQTVRNWFPASPAVSKVLQVYPDGSGGYVTGMQSCT